MDGWNTTFLLGRPIFIGYVSFREGIDNVFAVLILLMWFLRLLMITLSHLGPTISTDCTKSIGCSWACYNGILKYQQKNMVAKINSHEIYDIHDISWNGVASHNPLQTAIKWSIWRKNCHQYHWLNWIIDKAAAFFCIGFFAWAMHPGNHQQSMPSMPITATTESSKNKTCWFGGDSPLLEVAICFYSFRISGKILSLWPFSPFFLPLPRWVHAPKIPRYLRRMSKL